MLNGHYHGASLNFVGFDDDGDGVEERVVYRICTDYQSAPGGGQGYIKMIYFDLANDKVYLNSYSPILDDFNYYDTPKLDRYGIGTVASDVDIAELPVTFDRQTPKTLEVTGFQASILTDTRIAQAEAQGTVELPLGQTVGDVYAVAKDQRGAIVAYSGVRTVEGSVPQEHPFVDVNDTDWFYEDVAYTFCRGILKGMDETHFQPQTAVTRGMVATVLHRLEECPEAPEADFVDVNPARYYGAAVAWAQAKGLVKGYGDGTFRPNQAITRQELATILYRYAAFRGEDVSARANLEAFEDRTLIQPYAQDAMSWAVAAGLVEGVTETSLAPKGIALRCQLAALLHRLSLDVQL